MDKEALDAIANRPTCCKTFGESVTISRAERDALVAMARDADRLEFLIADDAAVETLTLGNGSRYRVYWPSENCIQSHWYESPRTAIDAAIDATMTKEQ